MVSEESVEAAVDYLRDTAVQYGQARGRERYCEANLRRVKALQMIDKAGSLGDREAQAYASPEYLQAMEDEQNAVAESETIRAYREAAKYKIEVWRSQYSGQKQGL
jgi:hypothetical protein